MKSLFLTAFFAVASCVAFAEEAESSAPATTVTAEYIISHMEAFRTTQTDILNLLKEVKDKESADAAAFKIAALTAGMEEMKAKFISDTVQVSASVMKEVNEYMQSKVATMQDLNMQLANTIATLLNTKPAPFYGSDKLVSALDLKQVEDTAPTVDISYEDALAQAQELVNSLREYNEVLRTVTDTASADAAADKVTRIIMHHEALCADGPACLLASPDVTAQLDKAFGGSMKKVMQEAVSELLQTQKELEVKKHYDSFKLQNAIKEGQK